MDTQRIVDAGEEFEMQHHEYAVVLDKLKEIDSRIDGLYGILVGGDFMVRDVVTTENCRDCQASTRRTIEDLRKDMIGKGPFWGGITVLSVLSTSIGVLVVWWALASRVLTLPRP